MSDIEKKEMDNSADSEQTSGNELEQELEQLKDLFQKELDNAAENSEQELIQQLDEIGEQAETDEQEQELPLCECCGEKAVSTKHGEGYAYCDECRALMVKYPVRFSGIVAVLLSIIMFFGGIYLCRDEIMDSTAVLDASVAYSSGRMTTAANAYQQYFSGGAASENVSRRAVREAIGAYMAFGATSEVADLIEEHYTEKDLNKFSNRKIKETYEFCKRVNATTDAVYMSIVQPAEYGQISKQQGIEQLEAFIKEAESVNGQAATATDAQQSEYDTLVAEYFIYYLMVYGDYAEDVRYEKIKSIAERGGEEYYWLYAATLSAMAAEMGDIEVVEECYDIIKHNNIEDVSAYTTLARCLLYQDEIDTEKVLAVCQEADEVFYTGEEMSHYRYYALAYLFEGETEKAFEKMDSYAAAGVNSVMDANLYALCALAVGDSEIYQEMVDLVTGAGYELSDYVEQYKAGKITIEKIFEVGGGDFI